MSWFHKRSKQEEIIEKHHKRLEKVGSNPLTFSKRSLLGYATFFAIVLMISFWGQSPIGPQLSLNTPAKARIVSNIDFDYISNLKTAELREQRRHMVAPVYKVDMSAFHNFSQKIERLKGQLTRCAEIKDPNKRTTALDELIEEFDTKYNLFLEKDDLENLLAIGTSLQRNRWLDECLFILQEMAQKGIFDDTESYLDEENVYSSMARLDQGNARLQSRGNALKNLRMNLFVMDIEYDIANALVHICKYGLTPNLVYDKKKTQEKIHQFVERTPDVNVKIQQGSLIVDSGQIVTPEIYECYLAYLKNLEAQDVYKKAYQTVFMKKIFLLSLLFVLLIFVLKLLPTRLNQQTRLKMVTGIVLILNVLMIRLVNIFCVHAMIGQQCLLAPFAAFLAPTFLSSLLITSLTDTLAGFVCTFFVVGVKTFIVYGTLDAFLLDLLVGTFIVFLCRKVKFKEDILRAGFYAYVLFAVVTFIYGVFMLRYTLAFCSQQVLAIAVNGLGTLFLVVNLIPVFEKFFHYTTNITFLNLTDYNHPLLRKLQLVAPGTYHHSLMVATLAEKAAAEIGANPLLCRCCALYHDIGKIIKPEYFTENQREGENPHADQTPSMSAIILKSHIKEGVELAKTYKLPKIIIDVIRQHHGTSVMQYFYKKALLLKTDENEVIDEKVFRYDGPKPEFKEAAIILLADAIEAASRSLEKCTAQSIRELIDKIVKDRIETEQLNACKITLQDLDAIKKSFEVTLLTMSHARVSYDSVEKDVEKQNIQ